MTTTSSYSAVSDVEVAVTRVFDAPAQLVFDAHTVPAHVQQWMLGPEGWTMPVCEIDLRPGGAWRFGYRKDDGTEMTMTGEILEVDPPHRLVMSESWGGDWPSTVNTLELSERDGRTTLTQSMRFPTREARDTAMASGMDDGVQSSYERLDTMLARLTGRG
jgi:uncharacterized protein YndB with AHSA1/START domain